MRNIISPRPNFPTVLPFTCDTRFHFHYQIDRAVVAGLPFSLAVALQTHAIHAHHEATIIDDIETNTRFPLDATKQKVPTQGVFRCLDITADNPAYNQAHFGIAHR